MPTKICDHCGKAFAQRERGAARWERRRFCSRSCSAAHRRGDQHPQWKGDAVGYDALHRWAQKYFAGCPCEHCGQLTPRMEWAQRHGVTNSRDRADWLRLCDACHRVYDDNTTVKNAAKTHCPKGHPYDEANTYRAANGHRHCRTCNRERAATRFAARAAT